MIDLLFASMVTAAPPPTVAEKLAQALVATSSETKQGRLYIGTLPPDVKISVPLPQFPLLGSVVQPSQGQGIAATLYYDASPNAVAAYKSTLAAAHAAPMRFMDAVDERANDEGGFVFGDGGRVHTSAKAFCMPDGSMVMAIQNTGVVHPLVVQYANGAQVRQACGLMQMIGSLPVIPPPVPLPTIRPTSGMSFSAGFPGNADIPQNGRARIFGGISPTQAGNALSLQFTASGWKADNAAKNKDMYAQTFRILKNRHHYIAVLNVVRESKPRTLDATIQVTDLDYSAGFAFRAYP